MIAGSLHMQFLHDCPTGSNATEFATIGEHRVPGYPGTCTLIGNDCNTDKHLPYKRIIWTPTLSLLL
eukprot:70013-Rhodomonas_salina.1